MRLESLKLVFATGIESVTKGQWDVKKLHVPVTAAIQYVLTIICVTLRSIQKPFRTKSTFCKFKYTILTKGTKKVSFTSFIQ